MKISKTLLFPRKVCCLYSVSVSGPLCAHTHNPGNPSQETLCFPEMEVYSQQQRATQKNQKPTVQEHNF